jgi:hypothetical protein
MKDLISAGNVERGIQTAESWRGGRKRIESMVLPLTTVGGSRTRSVNGTQ